MLLNEVTSSLFWFVVVLVFFKSYVIEHTTSSSVSKKPRLDQIPAANLDADDPLTDVCISFLSNFLSLSCFQGLVLIEYILLDLLKI